MTSQEIFDKLLQYREDSVRGNKMLDEYFDAIMYSVAKVLELSDEQAHELAGEEPREKAEETTMVKEIVLDPAQFEITDGYVGRLGITFDKATEQTLSDSITKAAERNNKTVEEIKEYLLGGGAVAWCDSPNYYYDHGKGIIRPKKNVKPVQLIKCDCGHSVPQSQVMNASMGSSCPDCYDRMSN